MSSSVVISHSEADSFLVCEKRHYFAFGDPTFGPLAGLEPKSFSDSLYRGLVGHEVMALFLQEYQKSKNFEQSKTLALASMLSHINNAGTQSQTKICNDLMVTILPRAMDFFNREFLSQGWTPKYVEETFTLEIPLEDRTLVYPFKPDAIMADPAGNLWVFDHKFIYNFYDPDSINLQPQIPKYIGALRALGIHVKGGYYNQIRWREVKDLNAHNRADRFIPSVARIQNSFRQQVRVMEKISDLKLGTLENWQAKVIPVLNGFVCNHCSFRLLCVSELNGQDTALAKKVDFSRNSYGYSEGD